MCDPSPASTWLPTGPFFSPKDAFESLSLVVSAPLGRWAWFCLRQQSSTQTRSRAHWRVFLQMPTFYKHGGWPLCPRSACFGVVISMQPWCQAAMVALGLSGPHLDTALQPWPPVHWAASSRKQEAQLWVPLSSVLGPCCILLAAGSCWEAACSLWIPLLKVVPTWKPRARFEWSKRSWPSEPGRCW